MAVDGATFRMALGQFASGVTVVTGMTVDDQPVGLTVSAFSSLSLDPPLVLVCLDKRPAVVAAMVGRPFAVNVLADTQQAISNLFASRQEDRFKAVEWHHSPLGLPLLDGALAHMECQPHAVLDGGDHWIVVGHLVHVTTRHDGHPLLYWQGAYGRLAAR